MNETLLNVLKRGWPYLLTLAIGVVIGYQLKPDQFKLHETEKVVFRVDEKAMEQEVTRRVKAIEATMVSKVERIYITKPDGTKITKENIDTTSKTTTKEAEVKTVEKVVYRDVEKVVEREKIITPVKEQWLVGVGVGGALDFSNLSQTALVGKLTLGRRIAGPFWADVWVSGGSPVVGPPRPAGVAVGADVLLIF